jgi:hypothetical protein
LNTIQPISESILIDWSECAERYSAIHGFLNSKLQQTIIHSPFSRRNVVQKLQWPSFDIVIRQNERIVIDILRQIAGPVRMVHLRRG